MKNTTAAIIALIGTGIIYAFSIKRNLYLLSEYKGVNRSLFAAKVIEISKRLNINPNWLMAVMHFESKLSPTAVNPISGATGLIQFMPSTAQDLGTTTAQLLRMNSLQQLDYVEKYLKGKPTMRSFLDVYLAVFYPVAINWSDTKEFPRNVVNQNPVFAQNGKITRATIKNVLYKRYPRFAPVLGRLNTAIKEETPWFEPYKEKPFPDRGKTADQLRAARGKTGCYLIKENNKVVYVGKSGVDVYKTLTRHFQKWEDKQYRTTYDVWKNDYKVKIYYTSKRNISQLECELYNKYNPRDNYNSACFDFSDVPF